MRRRRQLWNLARTCLSALIEMLLRLEAEVRALRSQVKELQDRLALTSRNSGKPPSTDGLAKPAPKSLRTKSGRRRGGQPGHPGRTLQPVQEPDQIVMHRLGLCPCGLCQGRSLRDQPLVDYAKRQVFELPRKLVEVTEHQAEIKRCPVSGRLVTAAFPESISAPAQYGPRFRGLMVYFNNRQFIPYDRLTEICEDVFGQPLSEATVVTANQRVYTILEPFEQAVKGHLPQAPLVHADESGLRVANKLHWLHVVCTPCLTFYGVHRKRGRKAMDEFDILPRCRRWIIHDHFAPYFTYKNCLHALCNEHHLRELKFLYEEHHEAWAEELSTFLVDAKQRVEREGVLHERAFKQVLARYHAILAKGRRRHPGSQGRQAQSKAANLLDRLEGYDLSVLAFLVHPEVPFTNNQGERDIRMEKVRQKISGCFRTLHGARRFARIRSYISTCRKQGRNILDELENAVRGKPFIPRLAARAP
jgi:transposase